jgi:hypothetical protein
VSCSFGVRC